MGYRGQRGRQYAGQVERGVLLGVHLADDGNVVAADDVQPERHLFHSLWGSEENGKAVVCVVVERSGCASVSVSVWI